jgi:hypothetical protein
MLLPLKPNQVFNTIPALFILKPIYMGSLKQPNDISRIKPH